MRGKVAVWADGTTWRDVRGRCPSPGVQHSKCVMVRRRQSGWCAAAVATSHADSMLWGMLHKLVCCVVFLFAACSLLTPRACHAAAVSVAASVACVFVLVLRRLFKHVLRTL